MALLSSPRRRRRLLWVGAAVIAVAGLAAANALLPSHGGPVRTSSVPAGRPLPGVSPADRAAALRSSVTVRPLANRFVDDLVRRRDLDHAYAMLAPKVREHYSLLDWQSGRDLPLHGASASSGGASVVFSGRTTVGLVASFAPNVLFAVRFDKLPTLGWRVAYMHQGQGSSYVSESNFSPAGFAPGSRRETVWTLAILVGGLVALIAVVAVFDRRLGRGDALG